MRSKIKKMRTTAVVWIVIAAASAWSIGCADNSQNVGISYDETKTVDVETTETETVIKSDMTSETDGGVQQEDVPVGDVHLFEREDKIGTMFYDLQLDGVTITDSIGGVTAKNGRAFMILDVEITPCGDELVFSMYAQEFLMICYLGDSVKADSGQDYEKLYPLEEGLVEGQLEEVWLATVGDNKKGKLIYDIPKDAFRTVLLVYDSYTVGDSNETVFGDGYMMTIPMEDWSREN